MNAKAFLLCMGTAFSALGHVAWAEQSEPPSAAASAAAPAAIAAVTASKEATTSPPVPSPSATDTVGKATLASWLDLLAAQMAGKVIDKQVHPAVGSSALLISSWPNFVREIDAGRVVRAQIAYADTIMARYLILLAKAQQAATSPKCGGESAPSKGVAKDMASANIEVTTNALGGWLPNSFNPWLAAVQTMLGTVKGISDTLRPNVGEPLEARAGLADEDLFPAATSSSNAFYVPPTVAQVEDGSAANVATAALQIAGQMTELATDVSDRAECKALATKLTQSATALGSLAKVLQPESGGTSPTDDALALVNLAKQAPGLKVLDVHLTSEGATDRGYSNLIPTAKRLMQSTVLARYRLHDGTTGKVLRSGTVAVFCQVLSHESGSGHDAFGKNQSSGDLCTYTSNNP